MCAQEHIECGDVTDELGTPAPLISLLDKPSSNSVVRTSQLDLREADRRGLLWLLDEEAIFPGASDQSFLQRLFAHYGDRGTRRPSSVRASESPVKEGSFCRVPSMVIFFFLVFPYFLLFFVL